MSEPTALMPREHYQDLAALDLTYWWFEVRHRFVWRTIRRLTGGEPQFMLDVGAGTCGFLARVLAWSGLPPDHVLGLEANPEAAAVGAARGVPVRIGDLSGLAAVHLAHRPDVVTVLDVLEHLDDPVAALTALRHLATADAHLVVLVPALGVLWSRWDEVLGHRRRYDRRLLEQHLAAAGWRPLSSRYLFGALAIPGLLRSRLTPGEAVTRAQFPRVPRLVDRLLTWTFVLETRLPSLPFGTSVAAWARAA